MVCQYAQLSSFNEVSVGFQSSVCSIQFFAKCGIILLRFIQFSTEEGNGFPFSCNFLLLNTSQCCAKSVYCDTSLCARLRLMQDSSTRHKPSQAASRTSSCSVWRCSSRATSRAISLVARLVLICHFQIFGLACDSARVVCGGKITRAEPVGYFI